MSNFITSLLAEAPPTGRIQGGWNYVWAAYIITWSGLLLYSISLIVRRLASKGEKK